MDIRLDIQKAKHFAQAARRSKDAKEVAGQLSQAISALADAIQELSKQVQGLAKKQD